MKKVKNMIKFNKHQVNKYKNSSFSGTGYLAFRDLEKIAFKNLINTEKVLDLGCGSGRSTLWLESFCKNLYGCDIDDLALTNAKKNKNFSKKNIFFKNKKTNSKYDHGKYTAIFSILMFFHFSSKSEMLSEIRTCYESLDDHGSFIIVNGNKSLYEKKYITVEGVGLPPKKDGDSASIHLKNIDCVVEDYYWSADFIRNIAEEAGFIFVDRHDPLGQDEDNIEYIDEYTFPPYTYMVFKK